MSVHDLVKNTQLIDYQPRFTDPISLLSYWAKVDQDKLAVVFDAGEGQQTTTWTYGELAEQINVLANWLRSIERQAHQIDQVDEKNSQDQTINQSSRNLPPALAFAFENVPEVILLNLAAWQAGWCSVPLDTTRDTTQRKIYKLQQANCQLLFLRTGEAGENELVAIKKKLPSLQIVAVESAQDLLRHAQLASDSTVTLNRQNQPDPTTPSRRGRSPELVEDLAEAVVSGSGFVSGSSISTKTSTLISHHANQQPLSTNQPTPTTNLQPLEINDQPPETSDRKSVHSSPALILYTSGTTALPKGAILTWTSLTANAESIANWLQFTPSDRWLVVMPLHHINSTTFSLTTLLSGATIVLVPKYSKSHFWSTLAIHACTGTSIVPTIAFDQLSETDSFDRNKANLQQLTRMQLGSAPVQPSSVKQFVARFGIELVQGYGQTETSLRSTGVPFPSDEEIYHWAVDTNTLGTELQFTNVTILNKNGQELPAGEVGEICVRGPIVMQQYLGNSEATAEAFSHNWFHSGDTGYWQNHFGQKYFFLKGRSKEIIKKGGVLISPLAVENALLTHYPDLHQAYIIGFPDQRLGEQIGLIGVGKAGVVNQLIQAGKTGQLTGLEAYEFPVAGLQLKDEDLPKTSTGKIQRVELRRLYADRLLEQYRTIAKIDRKTRLTSQASSLTFTFRLIGAEESELLDQAVEIDQNRWGKDLAGTKPQFEQRAKHGVLIGCIDNQGKLLGTISALRIMQTDLDQTGKSNFWTSTWDGVTGDGTLRTNNHKGDCLLLVAVASLGKKIAQQSTASQDHLSSVVQLPKTPTAQKPIKLDEQHLNDYLHSHQDPVLSFHYSAKGGLDEGARFVKALPHARPDDMDSLGYCVLVEYPVLNQTPSINQQASLGSQLVEAALLFAYQQGIKHVFAYSRPVGLSKCFMH